jgi:hypothetical protein
LVPPHLTKVVDHNLELVAIRLVEQGLLGVVLVVSLAGLVEVLEPISTLRISSEVLLAMVGGGEGGMHEIHFNRKKF